MKMIKINFFFQVTAIGFLFHFIIFLEFGFAVIGIPKFAKTHRDGVSSTSTHYSVASTATTSCPSGYKLHRERLGSEHDDRVICKGDSVLTAIQSGQKTRSWRSLNGGVGRIGDPELPPSDLYERCETSASFRGWGIQTSGVGTGSANCINNEKLEPGIACNGNTDCKSGRCRNFTSSSSKFCVADGRECSKSGTPGYDIDQVITGVGGSYICKGADPNAFFELIVKKGNGEACTENLYCTSGNCAKNNPSLNTKFCAPQGKACGRAGNTNGFAENEILTTEGSGHGQVKYKCTTSNGFQGLTKTELICPATIKVAPISSIDAQFSKFLVKKEFKDVPFYQIYLTSTYMRCYYGFGQDVSQVSYLQLDHSYKSNCYPILNSSGHMYSKSLDKKVSCWK